MSDFIHSAESVFQDFDRRFLKRYGEVHNRICTSPIGEYISNRDNNKDGGNSSSQTLRLMGFTACIDQLVSTVRTATATQAAAATPTLCRIGVWQLSDDLTTWNLVGSTANDTSLWSATQTTYNTPFTTPWQKIAGKRYAVGTLIVTGVAANNFQSPNATSNGPFTAMQQNRPFYSGSLAGQNDLPATFTDASVSANGTYFHAFLF